MEVTLVSKLLATLADVILYTLMIVPVVSVILRDRFKIANVTGVFAFVVARGQRSSMVKFGSSKWYAGIICV